MSYKDKEARREYSRQHYLSNKAKYVANQRKRREGLKEWVQGLKAEAQCVACKEAEFCCLEFHHLDPEQKDFSIADAFSRNIGREKLEQELAKCVIVCSNCHKKIHAGIISLNETD